MSPVQVGVGAGAVRVYECWAGPYDGKHIALPEGQTELRLVSPADGEHWAKAGHAVGGSIKLVTHRYTVVGDMLVYRGTP